jgi:hypothetical protein
VDLRRFTADLLDAPVDLRGLLAIARESARLFEISQRFCRAPKLG